MSEPIRILIVEDMPPDAELAMHEIHKALVDCVFQRVETEPDFLDSLEKFKPDLIISDYHLPQFDGMRALKLALERVPLTPVVIYTGSLSEDIAVDCMKEGAVNYIIKENIKRLGPAIVHALEEKRVRLQRDRAEKDLQESILRYRTLVNKIPAIVYIDDLTAQPARTKFISPQVESIFGFTPEEWIRGGFELWKETIHPDDRDRVTAEYQNCAEAGRGLDYEYRVISKSGQVVWVHDQSTTLTDQEGKLLETHGIVYNVTERKQDERVIQMRTEDLALVNTLNEALNRGENIHRIMDVFTEEIKHMIPACRGSAIYLLDAGSSCLEMRSMSFSNPFIERVEKLIGRSIPQIKFPIQKDGYFQKMLADEQGTVISDRKSIMHWMAEFGETVSLPSPVRAALVKFVPQMYELLEIKSVITVPLISAGTTIGLLDIAGEHPFTKEDLQRIRNISGQMTEVILRRQAEEKIKSQVNYLNALRDIDRTIASSFDLRLNLNNLLSHALSLLSVDAGMVLVTNYPLNRLEYAAGQGFWTRKVETATIRIGEGLAGRATMERQPILIPDLAREPGNPFLDILLKEEKFVSCYGMPLIVKGKVIGVLELFHRSMVERDQEWLDLLNVLAGQAAIAVDNAQLFEGMQRSNMELRMAYDATIEGWSHALDLRDRETEGHSQRVTRTTLHLAEKLGLDQERLIRIRRGALLHDIGKLGVPDSILLKPDKLTDEEWAIMRKHPTLAYDLLMPIDYLRLSVDIPYCHHEKWDGTGYPRGLKGEQIPLDARIFAVVDVWDALRSDRSYRAAWAEEQAKDYLFEQSGRHFDPKIVEVFLSLISESG